MDLEEMQDDRHEDDRSRSRPTRAAPGILTQHSPIGLRLSQIDL